MSFGLKLMKISFPCAFQPPSGLKKCTNLQVFEKKRRNNLKDLWPFPPFLEHSWVSITGGLVDC